MNLHPNKTIALRLGWLLLLLAGQSAADTDPQPDLITNPVPSHFNICFDHGCQSLTDVKLTPRQWRDIRRIFFPAARSPREERDRIARAIALLEQTVGSMTGTNQDRGGNLTGMLIPKQMDCIDESTNSHTYLVMMANDKLLKFHAPVDKATRILPYLFPHTTAVIEHSATGQQYAVDSWFEDNGKPPHIIPLDAWRWGWTPGDKIPDEN